MRYVYPSCHQRINNSMKNLLILISTAIILPLHAEPLKVGDIFGDHMVIQREMDHKVWGSGTKGDTITVNFRGQTARTTVDPKTGKWQLVIPTGNAGGPFELSVQSKNKTVSYKDVLVGDVWVCVGQSNMERGMGRSALAKGLEDRIRFFNVRNEAFVFDEEMAEANDKLPHDRPWRVCDTDGARGFTVVGFHFAYNLIKEIDVPLGMISSDMASSDLESWMSRDALRKDPKSAKELEAFLKKRPVNQPARSKARNYSFLYSTMLRPLMNSGIKGVLYYQGEDNVNNNYRDYAKRMKNMVTDWRAKWGVGEFPFYCVQIAPLGYESKQFNGANLIHEAQLEIMDLLTNSGTVIQTDIPGTWRSLHPGGKNIVGKRLAQWALNKDYGKKDVAYTGPLFKDITWNDGVATISFNYGDGLHFTGYYPKGIQVLDSKRTYYPYDVNIENDKLVISSPVDLPDDVSVRYGWLAKGADFPLNLYNEDMMPAAQFRTDTFTTTIESRWRTSVSSEADCHGAISPKGSRIHFRGDYQIYCIQPDPGYQVSSITVDGKTISGDQLSFQCKNNPTAAIYKHHVEVSSVRGIGHEHITAHFEPISDKTYHIHTKVNSGGQILPKAEDKIVAYHGTQALLKFLPNIDQEIANVSIDGESAGKINQYTFPKITKDHSIEVQFCPRTVTEWNKTKRLDPIEKSAWSNGLPEQNGPLGIIAGSAKTLADEISDWALLVDGGKLKVGSPKLTRCNIELRNKGKLIAGGTLKFSFGTITIGQDCVLGVAHRNITLDNANQSNQNTKIVIQPGGKMERRDMSIINGAYVEQHGGICKVRGMHLDSGNYHLSAGELATGKIRNQSSGYINFIADGNQQGTWTVHAKEISNDDVKQIINRGNVRINGKMVSTDAFKLTSKQADSITVEIAK